MENIKVSVIVPIYNGAQFVDECVKQLVNQTLKEIEIIFVNDGSTDNSLEICKNLEKEYNNIIAINQENKGVSSARNNGIKVAKGKYVVFFDVDDKYDIDICEFLYEIAEKNNAYIACMEDIGEKAEINIFNKNESLQKLLEMKISMSSCNKMFKRDLINDNLFPHGVKIYEDLDAVYNAIKSCAIVVCTNEKKYHYIKRENSSSRVKVFEKKYFDAIKVVDNIYEDVKVNYPQLLEFAEKRKAITYLRISKIYYRRKAPKEFREEIKILRKYLISLDKNQIDKYYDKKTEKIRYYLLRYCMPLFKLMVNTLDKM